VFKELLVVPVPSCDKGGVISKEESFHLYLCGLEAIPRDVERGKPFFEKIVDYIEEDSREGTALEETNTIVYLFGAKVGVITCAMSWL
jgi:hypothetical protein